MVGRPEAILAADKVDPKSLPVPVVPRANNLAEQILWILCEASASHFFCLAASQSSVRFA